MDQPSDRDSSFFDPATLRRLLRHLQGTDVEELEIAYASARLYVRREPGARAPQVRDENVDRPSSDAEAVAAPLTGVFYARPSPEQPPYVRVGDTVAAGQTVALIETMKLFNEVSTDIAGEVIRIVLQEGDLVEAGQPIMYVRASAEGEGE